MTALDPCHHSRPELLLLLGSHHAGRTPRIDNLGNRTEATVRLLQMVGEELQDLHVLAYDRQAARDDIAVAGGSRDYALDTNGDPQARDAYRALAFAQLDAIEVVALAAHDVLRILRSGARGRPGRRTVKAIELAEAISAQAQRAASGEYTPVARETQPEAKLAAAAVDQVVRENEELRLRTERQARQLRRAEAHIAGLEDEAAALRQALKKR